MNAPRGGTQNHEALFHSARYRRFEKTSQITEDAIDNWQTHNKESREQIRCMVSLGRLQARIYTADAYIVSAQRATVPPSGTSTPVRGSRSNRRSGSSASRSSRVRRISEEAV
jgi:hypothetical protein